MSCVILALLHTNISIWNGNNKFNIHNMKDQNKENNINKKISQYFIPSNKNSNKIIPIHTINIEKLNSIYLISMQDTKKQ